MNRIIVILITLVIGLSAACVDSEPRLPLRKDCIAKVILDWPPALSSSAKEETVEDIVDAIMFSGARGGPDHHPSLAVQGKSRELLYMQFRKDCKHRVRNAQELMAYVKTVVPNSPMFRTSTKTVKPSAETISVWGPHWRDKPEHAW
jgi:hypothetical protein